LVNEVLVAVSGLQAAEVLAANGVVCMALLEPDCMEPGVAEEYMAVVLALLDRLDFMEGLDYMGEEYMVFAPHILDNGLEVDCMAEHRVNMVSDQSLVAVALSGELVVELYHNWVERMELLVKEYMESVPHNHNMADNGLNGAPAVEVDSWVA
jgi:hypothetical protein